MVLNLRFKVWSGFPGDSQERWLRPWEAMDDYTRFLVYFRENQGMHVI